MAYHLIVNLDKKQYIYPHALGDGLKLREQGNSVGGSMSALCVLLAASNRNGICRGSGDLNYQGPGAELIGSWAGDRIAIIGDNPEVRDLPEGSGYDATDLYRLAAEEFEDLATKLRPILQVFSDVKFAQQELCFRSFTEGQSAACLQPDTVLVAGLSQSRCDRLANWLDEVMDINRDSQGKTRVDSIKAIVRQVRDELRGQK